MNSEFSLNSTEKSIYLVSTASTNHIKLKETHLCIYKLQFVTVAIFQRFSLFFVMNHAKLLCFSFVQPICR